jgi:hypothetical protein
MDGNKVRAPLSDTSSPVKPRSKLLGLALSNEGLALATWLQAIAVIVTLYVVNGQLGEAIAQNEGARNQKFYEFREKYATEVGPAAFQAAGLWYRSGLPDATEAGSQTELAAFNKKFQGSTIEAAIQRQVDLLQAMDRCKDGKICPTEATSDFICHEAGQTWTLMFRGKSPKIQGVDTRAVQQTGSDIDRLVGDNCGLFKRIRTYGWK